MSDGLLQQDASMFVRAFPTPPFLSIPAAGVNITDYSIKHVMCASHKQHFHVQSHGKLDLPLGTVEHGEIKDAAVLQKMLVRMREEHKYRYVHVALPEEHAYLFQIRLPKGTEQEIQQMLEFRLKENVPFGADEAAFDYNILHVSSDFVDLNVSAYPIAIVDQYVTTLHDAGLVPLSLEIEGQATARALLTSADTTPTLILDIGRNETSLSISTKNTVIFTATLDIGGDLLTRAIARGLNLSFQEAERLKRKYGFRYTEDSADVYEQLLPIMGEFKEAVSKHLMYWRMHPTVSGVATEEVRHIILAGGNANIAGVAEYLESELGVSVVVGNVWKRLFSFDEYLPDIRAHESTEYTTAVGLALRSVIRGM